jgi:hypothetical protein
MAGRARWNQRVAACLAAGLVTGACSDRTVMPATATPPARAQAELAAAARGSAQASRLVLDPPGKTFEIAAGRFGPCDLEIDPDTHVAIVACEKQGSAGDEGILINFYVPGIWTDASFSAASVAERIRDEHRPGKAFLAGFGAPDPVTRDIHYHLALQALDPGGDSGQAQLMRVAPLGKSGVVYAMYYSKVLRAAPSQLPDVIRDWLASNMASVGRDLVDLQPSESWSLYLKLANEHAQRQAAPLAASRSQDS